jgi:hypothetical protein
VTGAVIVVVAILLGLPLLAWWVGSRRVWSRLRPGAIPIRGVTPCVSSG